MLVFLQSLWFIAVFLFPGQTSIYSARFLWCSDECEQPHFIFVTSQIFFHKSLLFLSTVIRISIIGAEKKYNLSIFQTTLSVSYFYIVQLLFVLEFEGPIS